MNSVDLFLHQHVHLKKMGKEKKEKRKSEGGEEVEEKDGKEAWAEKTKYLSPISKPLASRKLTKRLYKVIKKGAGCEMYTTFEIYPAEIMFLD